MIWARDEAKTAAAKAELETYGVKVLMRKVDISSEDQIIAGYEEVISTFGRVDTVIANAGLPPPRGNTLEQPTQNYLTFLDTSLHGSLYTLREGARCMVKRAEAGEPGGSLIFCGSLSMFNGLPGKIPYAASKAAMGAVIRCMAAEFGKYGIRANTVAPGYIKTGMTGADDELTPVDKFMVGKSAIPRVGRMADFEGIAAYLASDASSFHSGDTIIIDGGRMIMM